jgi:uncharacterized protein (TIGR00251 family)
MLKESKKELLCTQKDNAIVINIYVQPRASRTELVGIIEGSLKTALTAPPLEGKANEQLISLLSKKLDTKKTAITLLRGEKARNKQVKIEGLTCNELKNKLNIYLRE